MPDHLTSPRRRTAGRLIAATIALALCAVGCGATEPDARDRLGAIPQVRVAGNHAPDHELGGPLDTSDPTVGRLDPDLLGALQAAARDAQTDGVRMVVTSGWRSRSHQQRLFAEAVRTYGSEAEARRYVSTPDTSEHVTGDAVDVGPTDADSWLSRHGARYGLCQMYANEVWHYELATTPGGRCPEVLPDASSRR